MAFNDYVVKPHFSYFVQSSPQQLDQLRQKIEHDTCEFLDNGGHIVQCPPAPACNFGNFIDMFNEDYF